MSVVQITSLAAQRRLGQATAGLAQTSQRLSSGLRINRASDDAAGLAIAENLNVDSRVYAQGMRNISDGISALTIADGALVQLSDIIIRQRELAEQAANGVYSSTQRRALQSEANALTDEYNRITQSVSFNNISLFDTSTAVSIQFGYGASNNISASMTTELDNAIFAGSFNPETTFSGAATDVTYADINGDGFMDIVSVNDGAVFRTVLGNGNGTFKAQIVSTITGMNSDKVAAADLDGDGVLDVVTSRGDAISISMGTGNGTFKASVSYSTGVAAGGDGYALAIADINGDGRPDILSSATNAPLVFSAFINAGSGSYLAAVTNTFANTASSFVTGDFNSDGRMDFVSDNGMMYLSNGNGRFSSTAISQISGIGGSNMISADFNQDGKSDIAFGSGPSIQMILGTGSGTFGAATTAVSGSAMTPVQFADLNGDGYRDMIGQSVVLPNNFFAAYANGDGTFGPTVSFTLGASVNLSDASLVDVNSDGIADVLNHNNSSNNYEIAVAQTNQTTQIKHISIMTQTDSRDALTYLSAMLNQVSSERGAIGAELSRFDSAYQSVSTQRANTDEARSQIMDADVATETANLVRFNILQSAGASLLAQIGKAWQIDLTLLQAAG